MSDTILTNKRERVKKSYCSTLSPNDKFIINIPRRQITHKALLHPQILQSQYFHTTQDLIANLIYIRD
jgi:hypothetical protein